MEFAIDIAQMVVSFFLITAILIQTRDGGLGVAFGGSESIATTRRGPEKIIFNASIFFATLFLGFGIVQMFLS